MTTQEPLRRSKVREVPTSRPDATNAIRVVSSRWKLIAAVVFIGMAVGVVAVLLLPPAYESSVRLQLVLDAPNTEASSELSQPTVDRLVETESELLGSHPVVKATVTLLQDVVGNFTLAQVEDVDVTQIGTTGLIDVTATADSPEDAATLATAYSSAYLEWRSQLASSPQNALVVVVPAEEPTDPAGLGLLVLAIAGAAGGFLIGFTIAYFIEERSIQHLGGRFPSAGRGSQASRHANEL